MRQNITKLNNLIKLGKVNYVTTENTNGKHRHTIEYAINKRGTKLHYGDIILRGTQEYEIKNEDYQAL